MTHGYEFITLKAFFLYDFCWADFKILYKIEIFNLPRKTTVQNAQAQNAYINIQKNRKHISNANTYQFHS